MLEQGIVLQSVSEWFTRHLVELLLGIILTFNVGAYTVLWEKHKEIEDEVDNHENMINIIKRSIFGVDEDPTDKGHLVETETRFDDIDKKLEEICQKISKESDLRKKEFQMLEGQLDTLIERLSEEEGLDFEKNEFDL